MFNMGFTEILFLSVIALVVIGPKQLPQIARTIGRLLNEFKRATGDISGAFHETQKQADDIFKGEGPKPPKKPSNQGFQGQPQAATHLSEEVASETVQKVDAANTKDDKDSDE
ncbi:MAG: twin-arginine translocase TatA/TatE family subunit [Bdellovibrionaceae bacterium]|jgi:sec-independent protein translocase protein TatB|nr:twin-arginine translocase TatA/TatE family subunit [Pseudobdellovibrionaceae bacterium]